MYKAKCRKCGGKKFWKIRRDKFRCKNCLYEFKLRIGGISLTKYQWKKLLKWFLRCQSVNVVCEETGISKYKVLKALDLVRQVMVRDVPGNFGGVVEVDETYLDGQKKNKRKSQLKKDIDVFGRESKRGFGTTKQPVFGILCRQGKVFARLVDDTEAKDLIPIITRKVKPGARVCSDTWRAYTGLAAKGYVHRTVEHGKKEYAKGKNHINGLEGFWGYLKRKLTAKGGVQRKYLHLFLGEYVWRYNHKKMNTKEKTVHLMKLIEDFSG